MKKEVELIENILKLSWVELIEFLNSQEDPQEDSKLVRKILHERGYEEDKRFVSIITKMLKEETFYSKEFLYVCKKRGIDLNKIVISNEEFVEAYSFFNGLNKVKLLNII